MHAGKSKQISPRAVNPAELKDDDPRMNWTLSSGAKRYTEPYVSPTVEK
jgi:hypothetical protein